MEYFLNLRNKPNAVKNLFVITLALLSLSSTSQTLRSGAGRGTTSSLTFDYSPSVEKKVEGSFYLFERWKNYCIIQTKENEHYKLTSINLNIERNVFESVIQGTDSLYSLGFENIERFIINGRIFKNYDWKGNQRIFETVYTTNTYQILKGFRVFHVKPSPDQRLKRDHDKFLQKESYFLMKGDKIVSFRLNKKKVLKLIESEGKDKVELIKQYAVRNKLSFNIEKDVKFLLDYSKSIVE